MRDINLLEYIKADRNLSFSNWRYRLLHWFFGVNPKTVDEAVESNAIPSMFYTHYCPLFHLTNLIVLFIPFVLVFKVIMFLANKVNEHIAKRRLNRPEPVYKKKDNSEYEKKMLLKMMNLHPYESFGDIWTMVYHAVPHLRMSLSDEEAESIYNKYKEVISKNLAEKAVKNERRRNNIVFWVNFSRVFIKFFMNVLYIGLAGFVIWLGWTGRGLISSIFYAILDFNLLSFCMTILTLLLKAIPIVIVTYIVFRVLRKVLLPVFGIIAEALNDLGKWITHKINDIKDFISIFYEENCPAINIVDEEVEL